ncbi:leucine-rich repeats and immunoglobulin-like domains protein 1 [Ambystoma mexicanum]|uniref:leucine-rich repeats and immunoglobulin-like domains protein 1 n=1 Tax=Ambystoma mexicanum TaxID=8296 RepID=UPI0037E7DD76
MCHAAPRPPPAARAALAVTGCARSELCQFAAHRCTLHGAWGVGVRCLHRLPTGEVPGVPRRKPAALRPAWDPQAATMLLLALLLGLLLGPVFASCPSNCTCTESLLDCSHRGLTDLPAPLPPWTVSLNLSYNKLTAIDLSAFEELPKLREVRLSHNDLMSVPSLGSASSYITSLYLHHNKIQSIEANQLKPYRSLETLDLSANNITEIRSTYFPQGLPIKELFLSSNRIVTLEVGAFDNLSRSLRSLRLSKNRIGHLPVKAFKLPMLTQLDLNRNRIQLIDGLTFHGLDSLEVLKLQRNNISRLTDGAFWGLSKMQALHLEFNSLTEVHGGYLYGLSSLQQLHLNNNSISLIKPDGWSFCQKLLELVLSYNNLTRLDLRSLTDLSGLGILRLSHNSISHIAEEAFKGLKNLRILELDHNEISGTIEDTSGAFAGLDSLAKLTLFGNKIKSVAKKAFSGLEALEHLDLGNNAIRSIQLDTFGRMKKLKALHVNSHSFLCDCHLKWFPQWLTSKGLQSNVVATCAHPESLKNASIFNVASEKFVCDDFPKPQITVQPENTMAVQGKDISLTCSAESSSGSPMTFAWKKDNEILHTSEMENFADVRSKDGDVTQYTTILHLRNVSSHHEGRYQCIMTNYFGSSYSIRARLIVNVLPSFIKTPRDVTVRTTFKARLECAAGGHPTPEIAWQKDGGTDFPAARDRRMHVMPEDDVFFIMDVKIEDMGIYTCTAQNSAGSVSANATLTVLDTPYLLYPLEDRIVSSGATVALQCKAGGSPPPRITWLKDDEPVVVTERHHFTPGNQLLIIRNVILEDEGKYTCEMSNTLGTERAHSHITISKVADCVPEQSRMEGTMTVGIITIAVVCSIVLTSMVWVCIIYQTRKKREEYSVTNTGLCHASGEKKPNNEAHSDACRQSKQSTGCNTNEACKMDDAGDGVLSQEKTGYGFPVVYPDYINNTDIYNEREYNPPMCKSMDVPSQKLPSSKELSINDGETNSILNRHQCNGKPPSNLNMKTNGPVYPSNHERIAATYLKHLQDIDPEIKGSSKPFLMPFEYSRSLQPSPSEHVLQEQVEVPETLHPLLDPLNEAPPRLSLPKDTYPNHVTLVMSEH